LNREFLSCPEKIPVNPNLWMKNQPDNELGIQSCTVLNLKGTNETIGLDDAACITNSYTLCQVGGVNKFVYFPLPL
jgi:hypothetical protein